MVTIDPVRILDTRDPTNLGLPGPFVSAVSQDLRVVGLIPTTAGMQFVVPKGATGVFLNVTAVSPRSATRTFSLGTGSTTFRLVCVEQAGDVIFSDSQNTALYVPNRYTP